MPRIFAALAALFVIAIATTASARLDDEIFTAQGVVEKANRTVRFISFELYGASGRYAVERAKIPDVDAFLTALDASMKTNRGVIVRYYSASGTIVPDDPLPTFLVASIQYEGRTIAGEPGLDVSIPAEGPSRPDARLARAIALEDAGRHADARVALDTLLGGEGLLPFYRALAIRTRADANSHDALYNYPPGIDRDRLFIASLNDGQALKQFDGGILAAEQIIAGALQSLGAHNEAIVAYRAILDRWPQDAYWPLIMMGISYRAQGQYERALGAYDEIVARQGPQKGMAFHYHRGWTLLEMGRLTEAVEEFTTGLKDQPDYAGAFMRRACAYAKLGRLPEALSDEEMAASGIRLWVTSSPTAATRSLSERSTAVVAELRIAIASNPHTAIDSPCVGYWDASMRRDRSPLLPTASLPGSGKDK